MYSRACQSTHEDENEMIWNLDTVIITRLNSEVFDRGHLLEVGQGRARMKSCFLLTTRFSTTLCIGFVNRKNVGMTRYVSPASPSFSSPSWICPRGSPTVHPSPDPCLTI